MNKNLYKIGIDVETEVGKIDLNIAELVGLHVFFDELSMEVDVAPHRGQSVMNLDVKLYALVKSLDRVTKELGKSENKLNKTHDKLHKYLRADKNE